jgi:aldehyde dehydrogenase (NAD+)
MESDLADYQPVGVVGQIVPWNFPLLMLAWKIAPAIAMGNTVVLKPASYTRLSALLFAEVVAEAGLPPGVINVITGSSKAGTLIVTHPDVDKIAFTGSTEVGRILRRQTAGSGKKLSLDSAIPSWCLMTRIWTGLEACDAIWFNQAACSPVASWPGERCRRFLEAQLLVGNLWPPAGWCIDIDRRPDPVDTIDQWSRPGSRAEPVSAGYFFAKGRFYKPTRSATSTRPPGVPGGDLRPCAGLADLPLPG